MTIERLKTQARWMTRRFPDGAQAALDVIRRTGGDQEEQQAVIEGVKLGQMDQFNEALAKEQRKLIERS